MWHVIVICFTDGYVDTYGELYLLNDFVKTYIVLHNMLLSELLACIWIPQASEWSESVSYFSSAE